MPMTLLSGQSLEPKPTAKSPLRKIRVVTAAAVFDGHDAAINIMRRILVAQGAEVIHLGHNRSVDEVVTAALEEDAQAIAVSSYQGGHMEFFQYMVDLLRERNVASIRVFGGGGGVILPSEIEQLHAYGVTRIFSPEDGQRMGLTGMIQTMLGLCAADPATDSTVDWSGLTELQSGREMLSNRRNLAKCITALEDDQIGPEVRTALAQAAQQATVPVLGITGTGGSGKSSLTDELIRRLRFDQDDALQIAVIAMDPSRRKTGGALLGDRIRMNAIAPWRGRRSIFMRSLASRGTRSGSSATSGLASDLPDIIAACKVAGFDLILVETAGIGQGDADIVPLVDLSLYVMTPEFGAVSQLEKIGMLDFADFVAINKFDRQGAQDALRAVAKQVQRNRECWDLAPEDLPVYGTQASRFNDDGVTALYQGLLPRLAALGLTLRPGKLASVAGKVSTKRDSLLPAGRERYLAEIAAAVRLYHAFTREQVRLARERQQLQESRRMLASHQEGGHDPDSAAAQHALDRLIAEHDARLTPEARKLLAEWPPLQAASTEDLHSRQASITLSGTRIPRLALPRFEDHGEILRWRMLENLPGSFPFTAGVFPFKRSDEDPTRMFAGEGDPFRTNRRFKLLSEGMMAKRLSTAFDSVTLYGANPELRPDIYGKIGNAGVSVATLDDMKALYDGFDLCDPTTSVSMTINGPAPAILAMFLNTAIDQQMERRRIQNENPLSAAEIEQIRASALEHLRGTVQADILKEDQGQNTCIFSTEFALKMMGDVQEYFIQHRVRNFYSVSISGYHIAEAGANPITQLAFTLANGFTYVEAYLARGMHVDDFAPNFSFFFSSGMDPEYTVLGRVARRIWALAMRQRYGAGERAQKLKYHVQTSGRSLHAQEISFNDIRTTLEALIAVYDNCNSLHTNAYDEAITTPTDESVRRALAIQLIINREWGLAKNENPNQGSFILEELTNLVEAAVLDEFDRLSERGGVLGAMETGYQRSKIQDESMLYEQKKHDGALPIIGVNTFLGKNSATLPHLELARSTEHEKQSQLSRLADFHARHAAESPVMLNLLQQAAIHGENTFAILMDAVRVCSLGQITEALYAVGGQYRRNM